jgi:hypothetical protein
LTVARYNADGSLDLSFSDDGYVYMSIGGAAETVALQSDGKVVTGGSGSIGGFGVNFAVVRLNASGRPTEALARRVSVSPRLRVSIHE